MAAISAAESGISRTGERPSASRSANSGESYHAFISYSHAADGRLAPELQKGLQRFAKAWYRMRALRIFRDDDSLSANPDLWASIEQALDASEHLILLASPEAAASKWVAKEAAYWCDHKSPDTILIGLTSGELSWDKESQVPAGSNALPEPLRNVFKDEPRVTDLTWARDADDLSLSYPKFRDAVADLAAPLHGKDKDELASEEVVQHRRTVRIARAAAAGLLALSIAAIIATVLALIARNEAVRQQHLASSRALAAESLLVLPSDPQLSLLLAVESAKASQTPEALAALRAALPQNDQLRRFQPSQQPLTGAAWNPSASIVLTGNPQGGAALWNSATGKLQKALPVPTKLPTHAIFDRTGGKVLTWNFDGTRLWNVSRESPPVIFPGSSAAAISPDDRLIATAGELLGVTISQAGTGELARRLSTGAPAGPLEFSPDGRWLAAAEGYDVQIWSVSTWQPVPTIHVGGSSGLLVSGISFSPDGTHLAISEDASDVPRLSNQTTTAAVTRVWSVSSNTPATPVLSGGLARWSPYGQYLGTTTGAGVVNLWDASTGRLHLQLRSQVPLAGPAVFSSDLGNTHPESLRYVATGSASGSAAVWDATSQAELATLRGQPGQVTPAGFSPDASRLLTFGNDGSARTWDTGIVELQPTGDARLQARLAGALEASEQVVLDGDPTAPVLATSSGAPGGSASILDASNGTTLATLPGLAQSDFAFDSAGRLMLVTAGYTSPATPADAQLRSIHGGALLHSLPGPGAGAVGGAVSPDGHLAATVGPRGGIAAWDAPSGRLLRVFEYFPQRNGEGVTITLKFSPDGRLLLGADGNGLTSVWNARTGEILNRIQGPVPEKYMGAGGAISPYGKYLVTVSTGSNDARLYRIGQPTVVLNLTGHAGPIWDAAFNNDATLLVTSSPLSQQWNGDGTIRVWSVTDQRPLLTLPVGAGTRVAFSANGHSFITNGVLPAESVGCVVCGGFTYLLALAHKRETRQLTAAERAQYVHG